MGHARVDPASLRATRDGVDVPLPDAVEIVAIGAPALGVDPSTTAGLIGEISSTLLSDVHQLEHGRPAAELIDLDPLELEGELRGHPWIVASKGRVGFSADDLRATRPRRSGRSPCSWLAVEGADARGLTPRWSRAGSSGRDARARPPVAVDEPDPAAVRGRHRARPDPACWASSAGAGCRSSRSARWPTPTTRSATTSSSRSRS